MRSLNKFAAHATEDVDDPDRTLCGESIPKRSVIRIDNADPDCKRCLRVIRARIARSETP